MIYVHNAIQINDDNRNVIFYVDAIHEQASNWMRFVNSAMESDGANCIVRQVDYDIYFLTNREIKKGEELMIWYGTRYAEQLGLAIGTVF